MISYRVNERRYEFGDEAGAVDWVCAKIPSNGRVKKDCVPKVGEVFSLNLLNPQGEAPGWYSHLLDNRDHRVSMRNIYH